MGNRIFGISSFEIDGARAACLLSDDLNTGNVRSSVPQQPQQNIQRAEALNRVPCTNHPNRAEQDIERHKWKQAHCFQKPPCIRLTYVCVQSPGPTIIHTAAIFILVKNNRMTGVRGIGSVYFDHSSRWIAVPHSSRLYYRYEWAGCSTAPPRRGSLKRNLSATLFPNSANTANPANSAVLRTLNPPSRTIVSGQDSRPTSSLRKNVP
jgi:hypothetical protein